MASSTRYRTCCTRGKCAMEAIWRLFCLSLLLSACSDASQWTLPSRASAAAALALPNFASLVKTQGQAVVNISASQNIKSGNDFFSGADEAFMLDFRPRVRPPGLHGGLQAQSLGAGFIISADGLILTNAHVVENSDQIIVKLGNRREYEAQIIGADARTDVALIKIDASALPVVQIGDPARLETGEWVAAIGAPFGFENSVTAGIVSARRRPLPDGSYLPFIQTDVALNPGSSGGPLFNLRGEVVGINCQIFSRTGGFMGISFAIPIDIAMDVARQLRRSGTVKRGRIGIEVQELTADLASSFGLGELNGALVGMVEKNSPAQRAGIQPGDVIVHFGAQAVLEASDLARMVADAEPDSKVAVRFWRMGKVLSANVRVLLASPTVARPSTVAAVPELSPAPLHLSGLLLVELTSQQKTSLNIVNGVLVREVTGAALRAGIQAGDVILGVNHSSVLDVASLESQLAQNEGKKVALLVRRGLLSVYVPLRLD